MGTNTLAYYDTELLIPVKIFKYKIRSQWSGSGQHSSLLFAYRNDIPSLDVREFDAVLVSKKLKTFFFVANLKIIS